MSAQNRPPHGLRLPIAFDDAVADLLKVKPPEKVGKAAHARARKKMTGKKRARKRAG